MSQRVDGSGDAFSFQDIHRYDGKLFPYNISSTIPIEEKRRMFANMITIINERANSETKAFGIQAILLFAKDVGTPLNFSAPDRLTVDDILAEIYLMMQTIKTTHNEQDYLEITDTVVNHICEQATDMIRTNGTCPQGRCSRMFQAYMFLRDYLEKH